MDMRKLGTFLGIAVLVVLLMLYLSQKKKTMDRSEAPRAPVAVQTPPPPPPPPPKVEPKPAATQPVAVTAVAPKPKRIVAMVTRQPINEELNAFDKAVEEAIARGVKYLWAQQLPDGSWPPYGQPTNRDAQGKEHPNFNYHEVGPSALAAYALLASGESVQDPRMVKALDWLSGKDASTGQRTAAGVRKCDRTYSLALRCNVWLEADKQSPGKFITRLIADARQLWGSTFQGAFGYGSPGNVPTLGKGFQWDNSNSQYGLLGVWAAAEGNVEVPAAFWPMVVKHWEGSQNIDGGWGYHSNAAGEKNAANLNSKGTMTVAGLASLFVCMDYGRSTGDYTTCREFKYKPIQTGLDWLDKNFQAGFGAAGGWTHYYFYGVERVGLACGYKYFGQKDWYKTGAEQLIRNNTGNWGGVPDTAFAVLFLIRGRQAVLVNRLQYEGDWNNRPRAAAWLVRWLSKTFERPMAWQIIHARVPVEEWHDAPILLITGSRQPTFSDEDVARMRQYIQQGGLVMTVSECSGLAFRKSMRELYEKLFPQAKLELLPREHVIYTDKVHYELPERCKFYVLGNGVRPLVIHIEDDLPLLWQNRELASGKWAFEMATNAVKYATGGITALRSRGISHWPAKKEFAPARTIKVVRLDHKGNCNPEPLAWERFGTLIGLETQTKLDVVGPSSAASLGGANAQIAVLSGTDEFLLSDEELMGIRKFVADGGTLIIDAVGGAKPFADSARKMLDAIYRNERLALRTLPPDSPVYQLENLKIERFRYRARTATRLANTKLPQVQVIDIKGRPAIYFSAEDLTAGLVGYGSFTVDGYEPKTAYEIVRNMILYAWQQAG